MWGVLIFGATMGVGPGSKNNKITWGCHKGGKRGKKTCLKTLRWHKRASHLTKGKKKKTTKALNNKVGRGTRTRT